jgi:hypothetical protein
MNQGENQDHDTQQNRHREQKAPNEESTGISNFGAALAPRSDKFVGLALAVVERGQKSEASNRFFGSRKVFPMPTISSS